LVARLQRLDGQRVGAHRRLEQFAGAGQALDVVGVGVRGDDHLAGRQAEVHAADQVDDLVHGVEVADVDEQPFAAAVDEVEVDAQAAAGLVVHLDDAGEQVFASEHGGTYLRRAPAAPQAASRRRSAGGIVTY